MHIKSVTHTLAAAAPHQVTPANVSGTALKAAAGERVLTEFALELFPVPLQLRPRDNVSVDLADDLFHHAHVGCVCEAAGQQENTQKLHIFIIPTRAEDPMGVNFITRVLSRPTKSHSCLSKLFVVEGWRQGRWDYATQKS